MAGHVTNPAAKFEVPKSIRSWVTSYNVVHTYNGLQKRLFMNFRCKFETTVRFADLDFLLGCKISAIWRRFTIIIAFYILNVRHISISRLFDLESIPHASTPTSIIPTKFEVDMNIHCRVRAFLSADTSRDLVTLTFDLSTLNSCSSWRVTWPHAYPFLIYQS